MHFYLEEHFVEIFLWESGFSNVGHVTIFENENRYFGRFVIVVDDDSCSS